MKKALFFLFTFLVIHAFGLDYGDRANWVICDANDATNEQEFDVFYLYPTLFADPKNPLMDWSQQKLAKKTVGYTRSQVGLWGNHVRVFAPYVRQLDYTRIIPLLESNAKWETSLLRQGIEDTKEAFAYYIEKYNKGRPFILFGHSQGAMDLYCLLKDNDTVSPKNGLVAAYLPGLPGITENRLTKDFLGREISFAKNAHDIGTIISWNTQTEDAVNSLFSEPNAICINPLNWSTEETKCSSKDNLGAVIYNYKDGSCVRKKEFCGAYIDKKKGTLITILPEDSPYRKEDSMGKGILHAYDIFFFAENIKVNAIERVKSWKSRFGNTQGEKNMYERKEKEYLVNPIEIPAWLKEVEMSHFEKPMRSQEEKMRFVIGLALKNVKQKTGGPFGAAIFDLESDCLVAAGVNCVVPANQSWAHAEMIAFARAQNKRNTFHLKNCVLVTSCEPCAMCFGATPWSGVQQLIYGAPGDMARAIQFDEGDKVDEWEGSLQKRGIAVTGPMLQEEAIKPFTLYQEQSEIIY